MKVFLTKINESWIVDKIREEFYKEFPNITTNKIREADIVWVIAPWLSPKLNLKKLRNKKVLCSVYHLDKDKKENEDIERFKQFDENVDQYHTISLISKEQIKKMTNKKITQIPFWVNVNQFYLHDEKKSLRAKYGIDSESFLVGSFQRDSEGRDLSKPKMIKGPDIFLEIIEELNREKNKLTVILTGKRRNYLIQNLESLGIRYRYFEMVDTLTLNELYNLLDLYVVSSRLEGGPQAIVECATSMTPIISTKVGVAPQILNPKSIFDQNDVKSFFSAETDVDYAKKQVEKYETPGGFNPFLNLLTSIYES